jgi:hypothetical protein
MPSKKSEEAETLPAQGKKWDEAEKVKFRRLVAEGKIDPFAKTKPTSRRFAKRSGEIGSLKRSAKIGRLPLPNFVLQSLKTVPEQRVR